MQPWRFQSAEPSASCANRGEDLISDLILHVELIQAVISSEEWLKDEGSPSTVFPDIDGTSKYFHGNMHGCLNSTNLIQCFKSEHLLHFLTVIDR